MVMKFFSGEIFWIFPVKKCIRLKKEFQRSWLPHWAPPLPMDFYATEEMNYWKRNNMPERRYTILSTASIPFERISRIPDSVHLQVIPFIEIVPRQEKALREQIGKLAAEKTTAVFTSAHAVRWVTGQLNAKPEWKIYCIRYETRIALASWFGDAYELNTADNAKSLSERILADGIRDAVFF